MSNIINRIETTNKLAKIMKSDFMVNVHPYEGYPTSMLVNFKDNGIYFELLFTVYDKTVGLNWIEIDANGIRKTYSGLDSMGKRKVGCLIENFNSKYVYKIANHAYGTLQMEVKLDMFKQNNLFGFVFDD